MPDPTTGPLDIIAATRPTVALTHETRSPERDQWLISAGDDALLLVHTFDNGQVEVRDARNPIRVLWSRGTPR